MLFTIIGSILVFAGAALIYKDTRSEPALNPALEEAIEEAIDKILDEEPEHEA